MSYDNNNIFARILRKEIPAGIVYEDDFALAFRDLNPMAPTHVLIIPKAPIATVNDIEDAQAEMVGHLFVAARKIAAELGLAQNGFRLVINCNNDGGQSVYHLHMHLLGGKPLGWPPFPYEEV